MNNRIRWVTILGVLLVALGYIAFRAYTTKPTAPIVVAYMCDEGQTIDTKYFESETKPSTSPDAPPTPGGYVALNLSDGREMMLYQTLSADGGRYANADESFVFWNKGNKVLVLENNKEKSYTDCFLVASQPEGVVLPQVYSDAGLAFSVRLPSEYKIGGSYQYEALGEGNKATGIMFKVGTTTTEHTNLSSDTYISVERNPNIATCAASGFLSQPAKDTTLVDGDTSYQVASTSGAGAGNRYEEVVYALPGTNPCIAVRYFIHYSVIDNYPPGTVLEFDHAALLKEFDAIRRTLVVAQ